ncbi:MAG: hypothetical protein QW279_11450 [Candidatus Jordarchaeaceae archaeon]
MSSDVDKIMRDYREKALASRTRLQRFVDRFVIVPLMVYFFLMITLQFTMGYRLNVTETLLKFILNGVVNPLKPTFLADFQRAILIHMWFVPPIPATWSEFPYTSAAIPLLLAFALFLIYFISRAIAYREVYYLDLGFLAFFVTGLILMVAARNLFSTLYSYYSGTLLLIFLSIPAVLTTSIKRPFTLQHVSRVIPKEIKERDTYKRIHYAIGTAWSVVFVFSAIISYIATLVHIGWLWLALFLMPLFLLVSGFAFTTHFPRWYTRRALNTPLQKSNIPIRPLTRIVGAGLIIFGLLISILGYRQISSIDGILNIVEGFIISGFVGSPLIGLLETVLITGAGQITSILIVLNTIVSIILMVAGVGIITGKKWGWYLAIFGLVSLIGLAWLGLIFPPNVGVMQWIGSFSSYYNTLTFHTPYEPFFFQAVLITGVSLVFFYYLFPKRDQYIL